MAVLAAVLCAVAAALLGLLYRFSVSTHDFWRKKGVPYAAPSPLFGNTRDQLLMLRNFHAIHQDIYARFRGHRYVGVYHARQPVLLVLDPELARSILVKHFEHFHDRDLSADPALNPLAQNLFSLNGHRWRTLRAKLTPTFTSGRMKSMFPVMEECAEKLVGYLEEDAARERAVEMKDVLAKFSTDVIGSCAFGLQMNALDDPESEFRKVGKRLFDTSVAKVFVRNLNMIVPKLGSYLAGSSSARKLTDFFVNLVKDTVSYRKKNNIVRNDFLQLLINLQSSGSVDEHEDNGAPDKKNALDFAMDDGMMAAQAVVFFAAGFETSSTAMSFALRELALRPDAQARLRAEVDAALRESGGRLSYDAVVGMKYLDKVVAETLRLYPPVQFLRRDVTKAFRLPGAVAREEGEEEGEEGRGPVLERGTAVAVPVFALHRDPAHFPDPLRFDPERFSEEQKAARHHYAYLPFGEGPRNCIGMRFGLMQTKLGLAALLSRYEFRPCARTEHPLRFHPRSFVLASAAGTVLRISRRP